MATQGSVETVQGLMEGEAAEADFMDRMEGLMLLMEEIRLTSRYGEHPIVP